MTTADAALAAWYRAFAAEHPGLVRDLADESQAQMREVLAAECDEEQAAYQRYQHQLAVGR